MTIYLRALLGALLAVALLSLDCGVEPRGRISGTMIFEFR